MAKTGQTTWSAFSFAALFALSALISGWIYGAAIGASKPIPSDRNDFWPSTSLFGGIEHFFNSALAAIAFSCFGVFVGAILGGVIGIFAPRIKYGAWASVAFAIVIPFVTRLSVRGQENQFAGEQVAQMQNAARQYELNVQDMNARTEDFMNRMGDLHYLNSTYIGSPGLGLIRYQSPDSPETVESYFASILGQQLAAASDSDERLLDFHHNGLHAEVTVKGTHDGTGGSFIDFYMSR